MPEKKTSKTGIKYHISELKKSRSWAGGEKHITALQENGSKAAVHALIKYGFSHTDKSLAYTAAKALARMDAKEAFPLVLKKAKERKTDMRESKEYAEALADFNNKRALPFLKKMADRHRYKALRHNGVEQRTYDEIANEIDEAYLRVKKGIDPITYNTEVILGKGGWTGAPWKHVWELSKWRNKKAFDALFHNGLKNKNPDIMGRSKNQIMEMWKETTQPKLKKYIEKRLIKNGMKSKNKNVLEASRGLLMEMSVPDIVDSLVKHDLKKEKRLLDSTINMIGDLKVKSAVKYVIKHGVKSDNKNTVSTSIKTLIKLDYKNAIDDVVKYGLTSDEENVREKALDYLQGCGKKGLNAIVKHGLMKYDDPELAKKSAIKLYSIQTKDAIEALVQKGFHNKDPEVRKWVRWSMRDMGLKTIPHLRKGLQSKSKFVRQESAVTLGLLGEQDVFQIIKNECVKSDDPDIVIKSVQALAELDRKKALPIIMTITGHENSKVNSAAMNELSAIQKMEARKRA